MQPLIVDITETEKDKVNAYFIKESKKVFKTLVGHPVVYDPLFGNDEISYTRKGRLEGRAISPEYLNFPFLVGSFNRELFFVLKQILKRTKGMFFLYGSVGTGKTHFIELTAFLSLLQGVNVFIDSCTNFMSSIKEHFSRSDKKELVDLLSYTSNDLFILDDIQLLNKSNLTFFHDILFNVINESLHYGKTIIITSDSHPTSFKTLPERLVSRLCSGISMEINQPDFMVKKVFIEVFCELNSFSIEDSLVNYLSGSVDNFRILKAILSQIKLLSEVKPVSYKDIELIVSPFVKQKYDPIDSAALYLNEFFGIVQTFSKKQNRRSSGEAKRDSIIYYLALLNETYLPSVLKSRLNILHSNHKYFFEKGKKLFSTLPDKVKDDLTKIFKKKELTRE